jgi:hypothetical protein
MHILKFIFYGLFLLFLVKNLSGNSHSRRGCMKLTFSFFFSPRLRLFGHNSVNFIILTRQYQIAILIIQHLQLQHLYIHPLDLYTHVDVLDMTEKNVALNCKHGQ